MFEKDIYIEHTFVYNKRNDGGVRQFGAKYITGGNPVW